jgi:hypothetical protein
MRRFNSIPYWVDAACGKSARSKHAIAQLVGIALVLRRQRNDMLGDDFGIGRPLAAGCPTDFRA